MSNNIFTFFTRFLSLISLSALSMNVMAQLLIDLPENENGKPISFVSCPVVQDTTSVPCWFAADQGTNYYLGITQDIGDAFHPPQLKHKVLVEGRILEGVSLCGAQVIHPVTLSVLPEVSPECNTMLPADPTVEPPPHVRGPGPSDRGLLPRPPRIVPPEPTPPYQAREYMIQYTFDSAQLRGSEYNKLMQVMRYADQINASSIEINISRGSTLLSNGDHFLETTNVINRRVSNMRFTFNEGGYPDSKIVINAQQAASEGDGTDDYMSRQTSIIVHP